MTRIPDIFVVRQIYYQVSNSDGTGIPDILLVYRYVYSPPKANDLTIPTAKSL